MARYAIDGQDTNTAATTIIGLNAVNTVALRRVFVYYLECGSDATPADNGAEYTFARYTAAGTSTAVVGTALDSADPTGLTVAGEQHTIEPTYTGGGTGSSIVLAWMQNQRATYQWFAPPGGELIIPATTANGLGVGVVTVAGSAVNTGVCIHYNE